MQNENNLLSLTGKRRKRKKRGQQQQQPAFQARPTRPAEVYIMNKTKGAMKLPLLQAPHSAYRMTGPFKTSGSEQPSTSQVFQAPHHQSEWMVDLTDDMAPMTGSGGSWKPVGEPIAPPEIATKKAIKMSSRQYCQQKWVQFKESLKKKKPNHTDVSEMDDNKTEEGQSEKETLSESGTVAENKGNEDKTNPEVIEGTASQIKLFMQKTEKPQFVQQKSSTPVPEDISDKSLPNSPSTPTTGFVAQTNTQYKKVKPLPMVTFAKGVPRSFQVGTMGSIQPQDVPGLYPGALAPIQPQEAPGAQVPNRAVSQVYDAFTSQPLHVQTNNPTETSVEEEPQQYSPSDVYDDGNKNDGEHEGSQSPDLESGQKRLSAFQRLGPKKKSKLTINLLCSKEQSVREVLNSSEEEEKFTPVHLRKEMLESSEEIVMKLLPSWPWKRNVGLRKSVTARTSKTVMILEQEQMEEWYEKDNVFILVSVKGFPTSWKKTDVLDVILESVKGKSFIPCFVEFTADECKFLVIRSRPALVSIHKKGFYIRQDDIELAVTISQTDLGLNQLDFIPRLVLRKQISNGYDGERKLSLKEFTIKNDVSHFIYFPLNRVSNQVELVQLQSTVAWDYLTDLDLSYNKLTNIDGFDLPNRTPKLKHLDLSFNCFDRVTAFLGSRELGLRSLKLEGNPLCHNYTDPGQYVKVVKMIFPALTELDGVQIHLKGDLPKFKKNYSPIDALDVANKFLEVFFPILDAYDDRLRIEELYEPTAVMTISYRKSLRYSSLHRKFRNIFMRTRVLDEGEADTVEGAAAITRLVTKWPDIEHDPYTFNVDVMFHTDTTTVLRICGILKVTTDSLADDEYLLAFARTVILTTKNGVGYKILNEMLSWDEPATELANVAFQMNSIRKRSLSVKLDTVPDDYLKKNLLEIFMKITNLDKPASERCLEKKEWNLKTALEHFMKLLKLDDLESLRTSVDDKEVRE